MNHYINEFYLTAAEVNAQEEMPLSRLVTLIIDTATAHANSLGFGYAHYDGDQHVLGAFSLEH